MPVTIELAPEKEKALQDEAARRGVPAEDYAKSLLEQGLPTRSNGAAEQASLEEFEAAMDELAELGAHLPPPDPDETYSRETIYAEHD